VSAKVDNVPGGEKTLTIKNDSNRLSKEDIERMVNDAEKYKEEDDRLRETQIMKNSYEQMLYENKSRLAEVETEEGKEMKKFIDEEIEWVHNKLSVTKEEMEDRQSQFMKKLDELMPPSDPGKPPQEGDPVPEGQPFTKEDLEKTMGMKVEDMQGGEGVQIDEVD
jgi:molecular chaperone DnaK (HSP70)